MDYITDDVIRDPNKSKLWTAIALSIFKLEHRSTIFVAYSTSGVTSDKKIRRELKKAAILKMPNVKQNFNLTSEMKNSSQIMQEKIFS